MVKKRHRKDLEWKSCKDFQDIRENDIPLFQEKDQTKKSIKITFFIFKEGFFSPLSSRHSTKIVHKIEIIDEAFQVYEKVRYFEPSNTEFFWLKIRRKCAKDFISSTFCHVFTIMEILLAKFYGEKYA